MLYIVICKLLNSAFDYFFYSNAAYTYVCYVSIKTSYLLTYLLLRPIATDVTRSVGSVHVFVCVLVTWARMLCKNGWTDRDGIFGGWLTWAQGNMHWKGVKIGRIHSQPQIVW